MSKRNPILADDECIYHCTSDEMEFALNSRKILSPKNAGRLNEDTASRMNLEVGFFLHTGIDAFSDDETVFPRAFKHLRQKKISNLLAIPCGYTYCDDNKMATEVAEYEPALIAKIPCSYEFFVKIRGSMVALYSGQYLAFSSCLKYAILDFNGHYTMFMGPRQFVEETLNCSVEDSWKEVRIGTSIQPFLANELAGAMFAYGY